MSFRIQHSRGEEKSTVVSPLERLVRALKQLPGVGEKTATRYAFHILNADHDDIQELLQTIREVRLNLRLCSTCFHLTDVDPCRICSDPRRDRSRLLVVETPLDLIAVEKVGMFKGLYHVLHGVLSPLDNIGPDNIRLKELLQRAAVGEVSEVILALNPTVEGEATANYIRHRLKDIVQTVSRIAYGIPIGGSLEYTDPLTLTRALDNRKEI
jgi:recombination protein RecR